MDCSCERLPHCLRRPAHITHETIAQGVQRMTRLATRYAPFLQPRKVNEELHRIVEEDEAALRAFHRDAVRQLAEAEYSRIVRMNPTRNRTFSVNRREHHGNAAD